MADQVYTAVLAENNLFFSPTSQDRGTLIAMSTHSCSGVQRWLLGSVTEKVVCHADAPVLVVRG